MTGINDKSPSMINVRVSEASRSDARRDPSQFIRFESHREEYDHYVTIAQQCDAELAGYRKSYYTSEQARIRREYAESKSLQVWLKRRGELDTKRQGLIKAKADAQAEISRLKHFVKMEAERRSDVVNDPLTGAFKTREQRHYDLGDVMMACLEELRVIRGLLERSSG